MATDYIPNELWYLFYAEQTGGVDLPVETINSVDGEPLETRIDTADFDIDGDGNSVDEAHNVQETVYEGSDEGITDKAGELMYRNDISIKEIHGLKGASRAEIYQRLGEPHGSVSGGSFQQFHYILVNGDIVIFSSLELDDTPQRISIYNKNGELKNIISNEVE